MADVIHFVREIFSTLGFDFRAEVFAAELAKAELPPDKLYFRTQSTFRRSTGRDMDKVEIDYRESGDEQLVIALNREGIYDMLPEGLFHLKNTSNPKKSKKDVLNEVKKSRKEEANARKFFGPFENEFFQRRLMLEMQEQNLLQKENLVNNRALFERLYGPSAGLDNRYILPLLFILPVVHRIRGNVDKVAYCLGKFLNQPVRIAEPAEPNRHEVAEAMPPLGVALLGVNAIAGNRFYSGLPFYEIHVDDIARKAIRNYFAAGTAYHILHYLLPRLLPMECSYSIILHLRKTERTIGLSDTTSESFLGFDTYL
jgi:hypothetical protein